MTELGAQLWKVRLPGWVDNSRAAQGQGEHNLGVAFLPVLGAAWGVAWPWLARAAVWGGVSAAGAGIYGATGMLEIRRAYADLNQAYGSLWKKTRVKYGVNSEQALRVDAAMGQLQARKAQADDTKTVFGAESDFWEEYKSFREYFFKLCSETMTGSDAVIECENRLDIPQTPGKPAGTAAGGSTRNDIPWKDILWGGVGIVALGGTMYIAGQMIGAGMRNR